MHDCDPTLVDRVRVASRLMVRELGFMQSTLAATGYPPSAVHTILEIDTQQSLTSTQLAEVLRLEKSSVSRMVRKLIDAGEVKETVSQDDGRAKLLTLTARGRRTLAAIHAFADRQVTAALTQLPPAEQRVVGQGLAAYAQALEARRTGHPVRSVASIEIRQGYQPSAIGRVVDMHAAFYSRSAGFGQVFESLVASGVAEFASRLTNPRNRIWLAMHAGRIMGSVAIDGEDLGCDIAHLRWFIVDDDLRGAGVGRKLLAEALAFCDRQGFEATHLWTFQGLDTARRLYEQFGFELREERLGVQWGSQVVEQRFVRNRPASTQTKGTTSA